MLWTIFLKLINDDTLCLFDNEGNILSRHKPLSTRFKQFKRVKENCNIIREDDDGFQTSINYKANIYCLDDQFKLKWMIDTPFENDSFPNQIVWDKRTVRRQTPTDHLILDTAESSNTFICASWKGITVTVDYDSGQTISKEFTK